jgi:hypothetical protein
LSLIAEAVAQSIDDLEKIEEAVDTASLTGWNIAAALVVLALTWPAAILVGRVSLRLIKRVPGIPEYVYAIESQTRSARGAHARKRRRSTQLHSLMWPRSHSGRASEDTLGSPHLQLLQAESTVVSRGNETPPTCAQLRHG